MGSRGATGTLFNFQPVMPFSLNKSTNLILRVIMPVEAATKGIALTVDAGIGYDIDWRTVNRLLIEGARRTATSSRLRLRSYGRRTLETLRSIINCGLYTDQAGLLPETHSSLRANVLDEFNRSLTGREWKS
jgi:hypothetical protein